MMRGLDLHTLHHFTNVYSTDGSKKGRRAAYGVWGGIQEVKVWEEKRGGKRGRAEREAREAIGKGMHGGRLPDGWDVMDAELFAIRIVLPYGTQFRRYKKDKKNRGYSS